MALLKEGKLSEDIYTDVSGNDALPELGALLISLEQWRAHRDALTERAEPLAIVLRSDEKPEEIADDISAFATIALDFPTFADGRAYSSARVLREHLGFDGELRAVGDVLLEQLHFMQRVGFNAFLIQSSDAVADWETAAADLSVWYQNTGDGRSTALELRHGSTGKQESA